MKSLKLKLYNLLQALNYQNRYGFGNLNTLHSFQIKNLSRLNRDFKLKIILPILIVASFGTLSTFAYFKLLPNNKTSKVLSMQSSSNKQVLASTTQALKGSLGINVPSYLNDNVFLKKDLEVAGSATFKGDVIVDGQKLDLAGGSLTASNVLYSLTAGSGLSVTTGQTPTITNTGVLSLGGSTGSLSLTAGSGISIDGLKISSSVTNPNTFKTITVGSDSFSAGSSTDTLTLAAGDGTTLTTDTANKKVTITATGTNTSGWTDGGTSVYPTTITDKVGIGTTTPSTTLDVAGTFNTTGNTTVGGNFNTPGAATVGASLKVAGTATISGSTVIAPTNDVTSLTVRAGTGATGNIFDLTNTAGTTSYLSVANTGAVTIGNSTINSEGMLESSGAIHLTNPANTIVGTAITGGWTMNSNTFTYRRAITVTNTSGSTLPKNYQIAVTLSAAASAQVYANTQNSAPYYDFRTAWDNSNSITEIARNVTSYTSGNVTYSFQLQSNISASGSDTYYIYYSNSALSTIDAAYSSYTGNTQLDSADAITNWASGDSTNYALSLETTVKNEGTGSIKAAGLAGVIGTLSTSGQGQLGTATKDAKAVTFSVGGTNYIYTIAGNTGASDVTTVTKTTIDGSGNAGSPTTTGQGQLSTGVSRHAITTGALSNPGTGADGTLDLSLGSEAGGCNGTGLTWTAATSTCTINSNAKSTFNFTNINIPAGTTATVSGTLVPTLYASSVTVAGSIDLRDFAQNSTGTGAGAMGTWEMIDSSNWWPVNGGSGAGHNGVGGQGGGGLAGGVAYGTDDTWDYGSAGGISRVQVSCATNPTTCSAGGGGIRILSGGNINISGTINADGVGGGAYFGNGGGSGGKIMLDSMSSITVSGTISANGGNGSAYEGAGNESRGGGGGSGGKIILKDSDGVVSGGTISANGGSRGTASVGDGASGKISKSVTSLSSNSTVNSVYVLGGTNGSTRQTAVSIASLSNSNLGSFSSAGSLPVALKDLAAVSVTISNIQYVYAIGGNSVSGDVDTVYKSTADAAGNLGTFSTTSQGQLPIALSQHSSTLSTISSTNYVHVIGGINGSTAQTAVYKATIDGSANIGSFSASGQSALPAAIYNASTFTAAVGSTNYIYLVGGLNSSGNPVNTIYKGTLDASGNVTSWVQAGTIPATLSGTTSIAATTGASNYAYVIGGNNSTPVVTVYRGLINDMSGYTATKTLASNVNLSNKNHIQFDSYSNITGRYMVFEISEDNSSWTACADNADFTSGQFNVSSANTWETKTCDISGVANASKDAILYLRFRVGTNQTSNITQYFDNIYAYMNAGTVANSNAVGGAVLGSANLSVNAQGAGGVQINYDAASGEAGSGGLRVYDGGIGLLFSVNGTGTASTSGAFTFTGASSSAQLNMLNGQNLVFKTSVGGDAGLLTRATLLNSGQFGIGSGTPVGLFDVNGANTGKALVILNETGGQNIFTASGSGTTRFVLTNGGLLGLGNSTPVGMLDVNGAVTGKALVILNETGGQNILTASGSGTTRLVLTNAGRLGLGTVSPLGMLDVGSNLGTAPIASLSGQTSFAGLVVDNRGTGDLFTASSSGLSRFVIKQDGNVGIGDTIPNHLLTVKGQNNSSIIAYSGATIAPFATYGTTIGAFDDGSGTNKFASVLVGQSLATFGGMKWNYNASLSSASLSMGTFSSQNLNFVTGATTALTIDTAQKIGIGTTSPLARLDVRGLGTTPIASLSGQTSFAGLLVDNSGTGDLFTASSSGMTRMVLKNNGNFGVGTATPSSALQVGDQGDGTVAVANAWNNFSDLRFKENVNTISEGLSKVMALNGVSFNWRNSGLPSIGFIAQEVEKVVPEIVNTDANGFKSLDYGKITPLLVNAIHEQQSQISSLSAKMEKLETINFLPFSSIASDSSMITIKDSLLVLGSTTTNDLSVANSLRVGNTLEIGSNSINTVGTDLEIQSLKQGNISFMGGMVTIDTDGNLTTTGDVTAKNITATGVLSAATVSIGSSDLPVYVSATEVNASNSAGLLTLRGNQSQLKVNNLKITPKSLIFVTPKTTIGVPLFIKEQVAGQYFIVGIKQPQIADTEFNYLIVN